MNELSKQEAEKERNRYISELNKIISKIEKQYNEMDIENTSIDIEEEKAKSIKILTVVIELLNRTTFMSVEDDR